MQIQSTYVIIGILIITAATIIYYIQRSPVPNEGMVSVESSPADVNTLITQLTEEENKQHPIVPETEAVDSGTLDKLKWKNHTKNGFIKSNYAEGTRGNTDVAEWNNFLETRNELVDNSYLQNNDKFMPMDETKGSLASYKGKGKTGEKGADLFKVDELLPQEVPKDWFEVMPEPIKVKNRHLINITKPVGINTIGTSLKNPSHDIRGTPPCPKFVVSPWLQSSIEPDTNIKGLC